MPSSYVTEPSRLVDNGSVSIDLSSRPTLASVAQRNAFGAEVLIPLYSVIFVLSVIGNVLVIATLSQNRRMRTVTNVFMLNLVSPVQSITFHNFKSQYILQTLVSHLIQIFNYVVVL